jgi:hypothetical protein
MKELGGASWKVVVSKACDNDSANSKTSMVRIKKQWVLG